MSTHLFQFGLTVLMVWPVGTEGQLASDLNRDGCVDLRDFADVQNTFTGPDCNAPAVNMEVVLVPGGGSGPYYDFLIGKYEVTNEQYVAFLNEMELAYQLNPDEALFYVQSGGDLTLVDQTYVFKTSAEGSFFRPIIHAYMAPAGTRFRIVPGFERHPVRGVSWIGALAFCNWLTKHEGLDEGDKCYTESVLSTLWRPSTISQSNWLARDLNTMERELLVKNYRGFRLPMQETEPLPCPAVPAEYSEWLKAASYDPEAPSVTRNSLGCDALPYYWGTGRPTDVLDRGFNFGGWYVFGTTPTGYYNGKTPDEIGENGTTVDGRNYFGMYDVSGNVAEWGQDRRLIWGGGWAGTGGAQSTRAVAVRSPAIIAADIGFRVVRVP